jgi:hypothetical protein
MTIPLKQYSTKYGLMWNELKWLRIRFNGWIRYYHFNIKQLHYNQHVPLLYTTQTMSLFPRNAYFSHILNIAEVNTLTNTHSPNYSTASNWCMYHWNCVSKFCFKYAVKKKIHAIPIMILHGSKVGFSFLWVVFTFWDKQKYSLHTGCLWVSYFP